MQELRLVAVSEDGSYAVMVAPGRSGRFALPIDERLRTVARGQFSRLAQYEIEVESPLRPKEIQDRIRAGETAEEIADAAGLPIDRIRRFEGPVLAEREFRAQEAQRATVRGHSDPGHGPRLGEVVSERLAQLGASPEEAGWDSRKRPDGSWQLQLAVTVSGRLHVAEWVYDPRGKHVTPADDQAARLCLPESDWPPAPAEPTATVTPIGSRHGAAGLQHPEPERPAGREPAVIAAQQGAAPARPVPAAAGAGHPRRPLAAGPDDLDEPLTDAVRAQAAEDLAALQAAEQGPAGRRGRRSAGRPRRSSVPSWDEIMFGTSRPAD